MDSPRPASWRPRPTETGAPRRPHVVVDLTPLAPGGENGGVKLLALELVHHFGPLAADWRFTLLTGPGSYDEFAALQSANVRCLCLAGQPGPVGHAHSLRRRFLHRLPGALKRPLQAAYRALVQLPRQNQLLRRLGADLLFCPVTQPFAIDPAIPLVCVICDLQHRYHPRFFSREQCHVRDQYFRETCRHARRIVCISEYVRGTVLANATVRPERVTVVPIALPSRLAKVSPERAEQVVARWSLRRDEFLLYPANFWPHKNHAVLLTALARFLTRNPQSRLRLVCPGHPGAGMEVARTAASELRLGERVLFPGYVAAEELAALLQTCRALVYPSLYEGFGMPILEAMAFGKPVLCSNAASLPEVAGDAALYFDPRQPQTLATAIEQIVRDTDLADRLARKGSRRVSVFGDSATMARRYLHVFREILFPQNDEAVPHRRSA
jgi:glycosyltransferase involved in cell wall biosynthesis